MTEEEEKLLFESFDKALRAERMAGPGGARLKRKIDEAITDGRLPKEFRGEAGGYLRKDMIRNLVESGQRIYPCAASNYCWFRPESALCTQGDHSASQTLQPRGLHQLGHYTGAPASLGKSATRLRGFNGHEARSGTLPEGASGYPSDQQ